MCCFLISSPLSPTEAKTGIESKEIGVGEREREIERDSGCFYFQKEFLKSVIGGKNEPAATADTYIRGCLEFPGSANSSQFVNALSGCGW